MISIIPQGDHRYNVYRSGEELGCIAVYTNPCHDRHCYLSLGLDRYDPAIAKELFALLQQTLGQPLQIMLYSTRELHDFLMAGGFERKRRCYELEVSSSDLAVPLQPSVELHTICKREPLYTVCCELLYAYYCAAHESVSPLTVPLDGFCSKLPETVLCGLADGKPIHYAFVEPEEPGYEIAYVGTKDPAGFSDFVQALVYELFQKCDFLRAECDDTDPAAMMLMNLFCASTDASYDTYILE